MADLLLRKTLHSISDGGAILANLHQSIEVPDEHLAILRLQVLQEDRRRVLHHVHLLHDQLPHEVLS